MCSRNACTRPGSTGVAPASTLTSSSLGGMDSYGRILTSSRYVACYNQLLSVACPSRCVATSLTRFTRQDEDVLALLKMVSGEEVLGIPEVISWDRRTTVHVENDPQRERLARANGLVLVLLMETFADVFSLSVLLCAQKRSTSTTGWVLYSRCGSILPIQLSPTAHYTTRSALTATPLASYGGYTRPRCHPQLKHTVSPRYA